MYNIYIYNVVLVLNGLGMFVGKGSKAFIQLEHVLCFPHRYTATSFNSLKHNHKFPFLNVKLHLFSLEIH